MTHGLMGNNGLYFPELDGRGGMTEQRNTGSSNQKRESASTHPRDSPSDLQNRRRQCQ